MLNWIKKLFGLTGPEECDHIYSPVYGANGNPIGQECPLCGKFNTVEQVEQAWRDAANHK